ncbi:hypothetical protein C0389_01735 [bacterium]|nr:hypothetical protein [bacterium]
MNTGQMMITIAAFFLLSMVILTSSRGLITTNTIMVENRYGILSVSLATSTIEQATGKAFDHNTDTVAVTSINSLTNVGALGLDAGELSNDPTTFNDFDDFNAYKTVPKTDSLILEGTDKKMIFNTYASVDYVNPDNPNNVSASRTWCKRISVKVVSPGINDTIKMSSIYSYWYFR